MKCTLGGNKVVIWGVHLPNTYVNLVCSVPKFSKPWFKLLSSALLQQGVGRERGLLVSQSHRGKGWGGHCSSV